MEQNDSSEEDCRSPRSEAAKEPQQLSVGRKLAILFSDPEILIFFAMAILFGFATGTIDGYLFLYLDVLGKKPPHKKCSSKKPPHKN